MVEVARTRCPTLVASATEECTKFITILSLLGQCHRIYNQNFIAESQCRELGNLNTSMPTNKANILLLYTAQFMDQFRTPFPDCSIPIKMHLVEEVVWARQTHVGFGLMGEQGAESIHARFNTLQRTYHSVPDPVQRLMLIVKEHLLIVAPQNAAAIPPPKRVRTANHDKL